MTLLDEGHVDTQAVAPRTGNRIVVVGNGMAGARTVEEILEG